MEGFPGVVPMDSWLVKGQLFSKLPVPYRLQYNLTGAYTAVAQVGSGTAAVHREI